MAVTATSLLAAASNTPATSYTTGSISPTTNRLVLACVETFHGTAANPVGLTGGGLTWTMVREDTHAGGTARMTLFRALSAAPGTAACVVTPAPAQTATAYRVKIVELAGVETSGTNGSGAVQSGSVVYTERYTSTGRSSVKRLEAGPWDATLAFFGHDSGVAGTASEGFTLVGSPASAANWSVTATFSAFRVPTATMAWTDASVRLTAYHVSINAALVTVTPTPPVGVPWWDGLRIFVELGVSAGAGSPGVWDTATFDTATWGGADTFVDVSQWVRSIQTRRRFARDAQVWETGEATVVLDNRDGRFSPSNLTGPYVSGGVTQIRPWRPLRIRFVYADQTFDVYRGYALSWTERYARPNVDAAVTVACVDEQARLAMFDGYEQAEIGGGETSGRRIHRILDNAGFVGTRNIDSGVVTCQPTTLAQNAVTEIKLTADSEGGAAWIETDGSFWFANQYALVENSRSNTSQATFTDGHSDLLPMSDVVPAYSGDLLVNMVAFARTGGTVQTFTDNSSRSLYGDLRYSRTDLVSESDAQVQGVAEFYLARYKDPEDRFSQITVTPRTKPESLIPKVLGLRVRDRVTVVHDHPAGHEISRENFVAGVSHTVKPGGDWLATFELVSATPYEQFDTSRWDVAVWDGAPWFY